MRGLIGRRVFRFAWVLLFVGLLDELSSGVPFIGAPEIRGSFALAYGTTSIILWGLPEIVSWVVEPPLFLLSDRFGKRPLVLFGLVLLGGAFILGGLAPNAVVFAVAIVLIFPASGLGVALSQAALMDAYPRRQTALMARWTLLGELGDAMTPLMLSSIMLAGGSWRGAMVVAGIFFFLQAIATALVPWRDGPGSEEDEVSLRELLRQGVRNVRVWGWSFGVALCGLLDETFVAFAALRLRDELEASRVATDAGLMAYSLGGVLGLVVLERTSKRLSSQRQLLYSCMGCVLFLIVWIMSEHPLVSVALLLVLGIFVSPQYPIAQARAYAANPGRSGTVAAIGQLLAPVRLAFPVAMGLWADAQGLQLALTLLLLQPLGLLALAALMRRG